MNSRKKSDRKISKCEEVRNGLACLFPKLWRYCLFLAGNPTIADDLAQASCLRALEKVDLFQSDSNLQAWVFRIAQRIWLNDLRHEKIRTGQGVFQIEVLDLLDEKPDPEMNLMTREVLSKVSELPEAQRMAVLLVYAEGFSYREAADILEVPVGTVMSRLATARRKINEIFNAKETKTA